MTKTDIEYDILTAVANYVIQDDTSPSFPLTGDEVINFTNIINEFVKIGVLDGTL